MDATCAPIDNTFPTDLMLHNTAREKIEDIIDVLHKNLSKDYKKSEPIVSKSARLFQHCLKQKGTKNKTAQSSSRSIWIYPILGGYGYMKVYKRKGAYPHIRGLAFGGGTPQMLRSRIAYKLLERR